MRIENIYVYIKSWEKSLQIFEISTTPVSENFQYNFTITCFIANKELILSVFFFFKGWNRIKINHRHKPVNANNN